MNGRVYDYNLGRFMSVDPFIQGTGSQGINPYSYVMNNPLSFTDPSGYTAEETEKTTVKVKIKHAGSRLVTTEEVELSTSVDGGTLTIDLSGGSGASQAAVAGAIIGSAKAVAISDIGSQQSIASSSNQEATNPTEEIENYENLYGAKYVGTDDKGLTGNFEVDNTSVEKVEDRIGSFSEILYHGGLEGTWFEPSGPDPSEVTKKSAYKRESILMKANEAIVTTYRVSYDVMEDRSIRSGTIGSFSIDFSSGRVIEGSRRIQYFEEPASGSGVLRYDKLTGVHRRWTNRGSLPDSAKRISASQAKRIRQLVD